MRNHREDATAPGWRVDLGTAACLTQQFTGALWPHHIMQVCDGFVGGNQDEAFEDRMACGLSRDESACQEVVAQVPTDVAHPQKHVFD